MKGDEAVLSMTDEVLTRVESDDESDTGELVRLFVQLMSLDQAAAVRTLAWCSSNGKTFWFRKLYVVYATAFGDTELQGQLEYLYTGITGPDVAFCLGQGAGGETWRRYVRHLARRESVSEVDLVVSKQIPEAATREDVLSGYSE